MLDLLRADHCGFIEVGPMTPDQLRLLNRRISEQRGWILYKSPRDWYAFYLKDGPIPESGWDTEERAAQHLQDWTGDDHASCVLLDEIPHVSLISQADAWYCVRRTNDGRIHDLHVDRRIAVALAWARWRGVSLEGVI